ncbi:haloalkane dehalogenase [Aureispira anguillae]|uniref:Haloalkane dehalogenase n=1 Tax=Aureispira anguillae TaxID=2864201 RepID=A0A916DPP7_9BACT|nr:haloalkane dehalogenase [Aureispira anguillae]BDS10266.1 haloalkane dehalogenase [Aureispira anguillae]
MKQEISAEFPFESMYLKVKNSKIHYIDEGEGDPILFLHGNPTSSYIWRNIIPYLSKNARCIAPDLIGFGKSDQPDIDYGFTEVYAYLEAFIDKMQLKNITIVVQDWGSGLGFHYANTHRNNIKGIAFMEAMYKQKEWNELSLGGKLAMKVLRSRFSSWLLLGLGNMFVKNMLPNWVERGLSAKALDTYMQPFKTLKSRKPVYVFPRDVPLKGRPLHTAKAVDAYHQWLKETSIPKICFYAKPGMLIPIEEVDWIRSNFPNITMIPLGKGSHFVQEDYPDLIGSELKKWYQTI